MANYTIKRGDTLSGIAKQYGTSVEELQKLNKIPNANLIRAGATITLPGNAGSSNTKSPVSAPTLAPAPTAPIFNNTAFTDTDEGKAKDTAKSNAENVVANYGDFTWDKEALSKEVWDKIFNRKDFSYDVNGDAIYQQYKDKYIQQGKMAMADTIGQASAMTGGYGNSYAASAGNQAYQAHLQQLNDVVPELYQMAYDRYNQEGQELYNQYGMLMDDHDRAYGMWNDGYNRAMDERTYANSDFYNASNLYGSEQDRANSLAQQGYSNEFNAWSEGNNNAWKQAQWDEDARRYALEQAWKEKVYNDSKVTASGSSGSSDSSSGSGGLGNTGDSGGGGETGKSASYETVKKQASNYSGNNEKLAEFLANQEAKGKLTADEVEEIYGEHLQVGLSDRKWKLVDDGGINWWWGVDGDARVKDQYGNEYRADNLVDELVKSGMDKKEAKEYVKNLIKNLGG